MSDEPIDDERAREAQRRVEAGQQFQRDLVRAAGEGRRAKAARVGNHADFLRDALWLLIFGPVLGIVMIIGAISGDYGPIWIVVGLAWGGFSLYLLRNKWREYIEADKTWR